MNQLDLFDVWERAAPLGPTDRALVLSALAASSGPAGPVEDLAGLPIGVRDGRLLDLYTTLFGPWLEALVTCPACGESLELTFAVDQLRAAAPAAPPVLRVDGYEVSLRPPDSRDLAAVARLAPADARTALLARCVSTVDASITDLPESVLGSVEEAMLAADPQAEILVGLTCEPCGHRWPADLDVTAFVWAQLDAWARRCALQVHALAGAYGWREADILAMSPWRRSLYLQLVST
jgi:hypothetical protein